MLYPIFVALQYQLPISLDFAFFLRYGMMEQIFLTKISAPYGWVNFEFGM